MKFVSGSIPLYLDDPDTKEDEGAEIGEWLNIFVNDQPAGKVQWTAFGDVVQVDINISDGASIGPSEEISALSIAESELSDDIPMFDEDEWSKRLADSGAEVLAGILSATSRPGDEVCVPVVVALASHIKTVLSIDMDIQYDTTRLTPVRYERAGTLTQSGFMSADNKALKEDVWLLVFASAEGFSENGVMFYLVFKVSPDAPVGETLVNIQEIKEFTAIGAQAGSQKASIVLSDGTIEVK